jgi:hypothetical protein
MRATWEPAAANIAASAPQIAAALSRGGCDDSDEGVATDDARLLLVVHRDDAVGGAAVVNGPPANDRL